MASVIPKEVKKEIVDGWVAEPVWKVCLLTNTFTYVTGTHVTYADLLASGAEVVGTGYTAGGQVLAGRVGAYVDTTNQRIDATNTAWAAATFANVQHIAVYETTGGKIRAIYDLATTYSVTSGTFTIQWNAGGLIKIS